MVVRGLLIAFAVLVVGWLGVLLRDERIGEDATQRIFDSPGLDARQIDRELATLEDARTLDPDPKLDLARAGILVQQRRFAEAAVVAETVARAEPANYVAWTLLERATRSSDPARAAAARLELRRLNPLEHPAGPWDRVPAARTPPPDPRLRP